MVDPKTPHDYLKQDDDSIHHRDSTNWRLHGVYQTNECDLSVPVLVVQSAAP